MNRKGFSSIILILITLTSVLTIIGTLYIKNNYSNLSAKNYNTSIQKPNQPPASTSNIKDQEATLKSTLNLESPKPSLLVTSMKGNIHIILPHNSGIQVTLDDKNALINMVASDTFHCNWDIFETNINKGEHTLKVEDVKNSLSSEKDFNHISETWFNIYTWQGKINIINSEEALLCE